MIVKNVSIKKETQSRIMLFLYLFVKHKIVW